MDSNKKQNAWYGELLKKKEGASGEAEATQGNLMMEEDLEEEIHDIDETAKEIAEENENNPSLKELKDEVAGLQRLLSESRDKLVRAHAEMENVRARARQDVEKAHRYGLESFVQTLLPILDSLEAALKSATDANQPAISTGIELTLKMFLDTLEKASVMVVSPKAGDPFDPKLHTAISTQASEIVEKNGIVQVLQKGYELSGRLIRPAMVIVSG